MSRLPNAIELVDKLPQTEETLWLRILGRDNIQQQAIAELLALPTNDPRRSRVLQLLVNWRITLETTGATDEEERSLMTALSQAYLEWEQETQKQSKLSLILRLLTRKVGKTSDITRSQIEVLSIPELEALGEALLDFANLSDLEAWLAEQLGK